MKLSRWLISSTLALSSFMFSSFAHSEVYTTLEGTYSDLKFGDTRFHPMGVDARIGMYLIQGLALEAHGSYGLLSGSEGDIELSVLYNAGLQSRIIMLDDRGSTLFVLGGYSWNWLDLNRNETGEPGEEFLTGVSYGIGVDIKLGGPRSKVFWSTKVVRYYNTDDLRFDMYSSGLRYTF